MANLSREEIATLAKNAGFSGSDIDTAVAVALAESGGDPNNHNGDASTGDDSYGLWQINMINGLGPDRRKKFHLSSNNDLFVPTTNARVAYGIFKEQGWKPWTTYTSGKYKKFLTGTDSVISDSTSTTSSATSTASVNPINGVSEAINAFGATIFKGFENTAGIIVAVVLVILGVVFLMRDTIPVGKTLSIAKNALGGSK